MSRPYISKDLRRLVADRAGYSCEYCRISADIRPSGCQTVILSLALCIQEHTLH